MKKFVVVSAGVVVLALGAAVTIPHVIDWNKYKPQIQKGIEDATGYQVSFGGPIDLAILPFPHVVIENMSVRVPQGTTAGEITDLLTLKKAEISVALAPLFSGEISVSSVNLVDPVITLDVARDGTQLWMTDKLKGEDTGNEEPGDSAQKSGEQKFVLDKLQIENGTIRYSDARSGKVIEAEKINTVISAESLSGPFKVKGDVQWNGQKIEADIQSGRIDKVANTVALQAGLKLPGGNGALAQYNGVVGTAGGIDLQGETRVESQNISATLTALTGKASSLPPLPLNVQGLLTAHGEQAEMKNLKVILGELQGNGAVRVENLTNTDQPMNVAVTLNSSTPLNIESFMPVKSVKTVKGAVDKNAPKTGVQKPLIPETLALPRAIDGTLDLTLDAVSFKGAEFGAVAVSARKKGGAITSTEKIGKMPGGGTLDASANLNYASGSQAENGGVVYSDPTLNFTFDGKAAAPARFLSAFLPPETIKSMQPLFRDPVTLAAKGTMRPNSAQIQNGTIALGGTSLTLGTSSYTLDQTGKNNAVVSLTGRDINLDHFLGEKTPAPSAQDKVQTTTPTTAAKKPMGDTVQDVLKKLDLPVDLTLKADLQNVTLRNVTYRAVNIDGGLNGDRLQIAKAAIQDAHGDVMQVSGHVNQLSKLSGVDLDLSGKTGDAIAFLTSMNVDASKLPKDFGPLSLAVDLAGEKPESLAFTAKASALGGEGQANGLLINALSAKPAVDKLSLRIKHGNFEQLMRKFNPGYKAGVGMKKDMDIFTNINQDANGYTLSGLKADIGGMTMTGEVNAVTGGAKPDIRAVLNADTIPLDILSGKDKTAKTTGGQVQTPNRPIANDVRWSRNAINTDWMHGFNLDLKVNAKAVEYSNWLLSNAVLGVTLKDGTLTIAQMDAGVYGGTMSLTADVKAPAQDRAPLSFNVKSNFKDVALEPLAAAFSGSKVIQARGDVSLNLEAGSSGVSPSALVSALKGRGQLSGTNVVMRGFDLAAMSRSLVSTTKVIDNISGLASASMAGGETSFTKINGPFVLSEGVIGFDNFVMEGEAANILNKGTISLPRWVIDMNTTVDLATPEDAPNLEIRFQGPLDNPGNTFAGQAMQSYIQTRVNEKLQKVIGDKISDSPELNKLLNNVLGGGAAQNPVVTTPATPPAQTPPSQAPQAAPNDVPETQAAPTPEPEQAPEPTPEERVIKGIESGDTNEAIKGLMQGIINR